MSRSLWEKSRYSAKIDYIVDAQIREFDISKANISVLRDANVLSEDEYQYYLKAPRMERQVAVGKLQGSDPHITDILKNGIKEAKKIFMEANSIDDSDILYIRNDAIAIIGSKPIMCLKITDRVQFRQSAAYTSFYKFNYIDFLYAYDPVTKVEVLDIKGLGDLGVELHKKYMLDFLAELFYRAQMEGISEAIRILQIFYSDYIARKLSIGYYRELNPESRYRLSKEYSLYGIAYMEDATEFNKKSLDISYNEALLRRFMQIFSTIYFK